MPDPRVPVFWVCGAPGAGKSVAAWRLFDELATSGGVVAYVDIDQLGMLYPAPVEDPDRHLLKVQALVALLPGYVRAGAQVVVVSGVVDAATGPDPASMADVDLTLCLLAPDRRELGRRLRSRGWNEELVERGLTEDAMLRRAAFTDAVVETAGLSVEETATRLRDLVRTEGGERSTPREPPAASSIAAVPVMIITGARVAGTSTVGFGLAMRRWWAGEPTGFLDVQQLTFLAGPGVDRDRRAVLAGAQLGALHNFFAGRGATTLIVSAHLSEADRASIASNLSPATVEVIRLRADADTFGDHVRQRLTGDGPQLAGDDLVGAAPSHQRAVVAAAVEQQRQMDGTTNDDRIIDVTGRSPTNVIDEAEAIVGCGACASRGHV